MTNAHRRTARTRRRVGGDGAADATPGGTGVGGMSGRGRSPSPVHPRGAVAASNPRTSRRGLHRFVAIVLLCVFVPACVTTRPATTGSVSDGTERTIRVTLQDGTRIAVWNAAVERDTLVGRTDDLATPDVRVPPAEVRRGEAYRTRWWLLPAAVGTAGLVLFIVALTTIDDF